MQPATRTACLAAILALAGCNESPSDKLPAHVLVFRGEMFVSDTAATMNVSVGKENSTVVVVMEGGDHLRADNGTAEQRMDFSSDVFGSFYRATFTPVDQNATYSVVLYRPEEGTSYRSAFPALPTAFSLVQPTAGQDFSLVATPSLNVTWNNTIVAETVMLEPRLVCDWNLTPAPPLATTSGNPVRILLEPAPHYLTDTQRTQRLASVDLAAEASESRSRALALHPESTAAALQDCTVTLKLTAYSDMPAGAGLSPQGTMTVRRSKSVDITLSP